MCVLRLIYCAVWVLLGHWGHATFHDLDDPDGHPLGGPPDAAPDPRGQIHPDPTVRVSRHAVLRDRSAQGSRFSLWMMGPDLPLLPAGYLPAVLTGRWIEDQFCEQCGEEECWPLWTCAQPEWATMVRPGATPVCGCQLLVGQFCLAAHSRRHRELEVFRLLLDDAVADLACSGCDGTTSSLFRCSFCFRCHHCIQSEALQAAFPCPQCTVCPQASLDVGMPYYNHGLLKQWRRYLYSRRICYICGDMRFSFLDLCDRCRDLEDEPDYPGRRNSFARWALPLWEAFVGARLSCLQSPGCLPAPAIYNFPLGPPATLFLTGTLCLACGTEGSLNAPYGRWISSFAGPLCHSCWLLVCWGCGEWLKKRRLRAPQLLEIIHWCSASCRRAHEPGSASGLSDAARARSLRSRSRSR